MAVLSLVATLWGVLPVAATSSQIEVPQIDVVGGSEVDPAGTYPFVVPLLRTSGLPDVWGAQFCGGSLVRLDVVLTAAHCVSLSTSNEPDEVAVAVGRHDLRNDEEGEIIGVLEIIVHPDFNPRTLAHDLALLRLERDAVLGSIVALAGADDADRSPPGVTSVVLGWGSTLGLPPGTPTYPDALREVDLPIVSDPDCTDAYGGLFFGDSMVCAGPDGGGVDSCSGDSGGPLVVVDELGAVQIGIVSWGIGCAQQGFPGVYTEVAAHQRWLIDELGLGWPSCEGEGVTILGTDGADTLVGTADRDVIHGLGGGDTITGLGGDDLICAGNGDDDVDGGPGDDRLLGGQGTDTIIGGDGADSIETGPGGGLVDAGSGADEVRGGTGVDSIMGGPGDNRLFGEGGSDALDGGLGHDELFGGTGIDSLFGGAGMDRLAGGGGGDLLDGGRSDDAIFGGAGDDIMRGRHGVDRMNGGPGDDRMLGNTDDDRMLGSSGDDRLRGGPGFDVLHGGTGTDICLTGERVDCD